MSAQVEGRPLGPNGMDHVTQGSSFFPKEVGPTTFTVSVPSEDNMTLSADILIHKEEGDAFHHFDDLELGSDQVPLGEILDKLEANSVEGRHNLIRLHASEEGNNFGSTISATVNVATLDLSDPESIHQHLAQLNDTVLKVTTTSLNLRPPLNTVTTLSSTSPSPSSLSSLEPNLDSSSNSSSILANSVSSPSAPTISTPVTSNIVLITSTPSDNPLDTMATSSTSATPASTVVKKNSCVKSTPQTCGICSKTFSNASALAKHRLTHSQERRYHCSICSKAFKRQDHLNGHMLTHRSTKPFACQMDGCGKSYCDARSLRRHKENHHQCHNITNNNSNNSSSTSTLKKVATNLKNSESIKSEKIDSKPRQGLVVNTKGLSPKQVHLIEQLFKDSDTANETKGISSSRIEKAIKPAETSTQAGTCNVSKSNIGVQSLTTTTAVPKPGIGVNKKTNGVVENNSKGVLPDKPVECAICSRKFKNIPALNGHMRLHGGYYKKDADGKRILNIKDGLKMDTGKKRKANFPPATSITDSTKKTATAKAIEVKIGKPANNLKTPASPVYAFKSLPPPNTSQLLANLERKNQEQELQQKQSIKISSPLSTLANSRPILLPTVPVSTPHQNISPSLSSVSKKKTTATCCTHSGPLMTASPVEASLSGIRSVNSMMKVNVEKDKTPQVGAQHQAEIPDLMSTMSAEKVKLEDDGVPREEMLWDPKTTLKLSARTLHGYLTLASSCLVPGGSRNEELALNALYRHSGNTQQALLSLMSKKNVEKSWSESEVNTFYECLVKHHKDFRKIAQDIPTKTVGEVVAYYYLWKNMCKEESQSFKILFNASSSSSPLNSNLNTLNQNLNFTNLFDPNDKIKQEIL